MTIKSLSRIACLAVLAFFAASCSKDDDDDGSKDPTGTITVNMMDENNGQTELGNSDVYIDKAFNFSGNYCLLAGLGRKNGLGKLPAPVMNLLNNKAAVEVGNAYQIFNSSAVREFPSGKLALNIGADYYNMYVISQIKKNEAVVGATVKFIVVDTPTNGLPEYRSIVGQIRANEQCVLNLPTADFEYEAEGNSYLVSYEKQGKQLVVTLGGYYPNGTESVGLFIRIGSSYTYVYVELVR